MHPPGNGQFPTTHWTLIDRLKGSDEQEARVALEDICSQYHYPLYCYIRRRGLNHHDAEDVLHDFLAKLLRLETFELADREQGRLRGFLSFALQRFLNSRHRDTQHELQHISLDNSAIFSLENLAQRYLNERFTDNDTPERVFERQWARELLNHVLQQLGEHYAKRGKSEIFNALRPTLLGGGSLRGEPVEALTKRLGMTPGMLRITKMRLLAKYKELLEKEVLRTVENKEDVRKEIEHLMSLFAKR
jgi:DNA-directed RNA polymerase specialized sigma24 family protein